MTLEASIRVIHDSTFRLDIDLAVASGETVALLGPNGAGKTTALRVIAGLLPLTSGFVTVNGVVWDEPPRIRLLPASRSVGFVFQDYRLFPYMSILDNVSFGLRARRVGKAVAKQRALEWLERLDLAEHAGKKPHSLSGGQAQRVALGRALVSSPDVLVLDEPLAALDVGTRAGVRADLRRHLSDYGGHTLLVTHDPLDAMVLADRILIVENGLLVQNGSPIEVASRPKSDYVAQLVGLNWYRGHARADGIHLSGGGVFAAAEETVGEVLVVFRPSSVTLHGSCPDGNARNVWPVVVTRMEQHSAVVRINVEGAPGAAVDVTPAAVADLGITIGSRLFASVKATDVRCYRA